MKMAGVTADQIDLIIVATITPDMPFPSTACLVQQKIGAKRAAAFDSRPRAPASFTALEIGQQFIMSRTYDTVLVIGAEKLSSITELEGPQHLRAVRRRRGRGDFAEPAKFARPADGGDGRGRRQGGSAVHARRRQPLSGHRGIRRGRALHFLRMDGKETFKNAVQAMCQRGATRSCAAAKLTSPRSNASSRIRPTAASLTPSASASARRRNSFSSICTNTATPRPRRWPSRWTRRSRSGKIQRGDLILLVVFGAGLTWGAAVIEW